MKQARVPYKKIIFVCTNLREGETACSNPERGQDAGNELVRRLRDELKKRGLKGKIRVARSGCMDLCAAGPNMMVFDEKGEYSWYSGVGCEDLPKIVEKYFSEHS